ncbi:unnamed protein product [Pedinophyceae sp. YPF-701]|nr:unnamed protein product [Pedinophyceae sp. YPF-701]
MIAVRAIGAPSASSTLRSATKQVDARGVPALVPRHRRSARCAALPGTEQLAAQADRLVGAGLLMLADVQAAAPAAGAAAEEVKKDNGAFGFLADFLEAALRVIEGGLDKVGVPYAYGFSIIILTCLVKLATWPLTQQQVESTLSMQALQPRVKDLQERYKGDQEQLQMETARLYREAGVNPLAGCLPTLATLPVWIGLYRGLSNAAEEGLLKEGFFFIPSLGGPTSIEMRDGGSGLSWLFPFVDGQPPVGWHDAGAYLILPILLVVSQVVSMRMMQPATQSDDPAAQQTQAILKFLPFMLGWFSLNVPSGLTLYWFTNNILTTAQQQFLRATLGDKIEAQIPQPVLGSTTIVKDRAEEEEAKAKKPTGAEMGARKKKKTAADSDDDAGGSAAPRRKKDKRGEKFRALKAKEAAQKAATVASTTSSEGSTKEESS